jgi:rSAM/selenodomain-associated transferase 1
MKPTVALFAKPPAPGEVKTRLSPPLTRDEAAALYAAFLADMAAMLASSPRWDWECFSPEPERQRSLWPEGAPEPSSWRAQVGDDLGMRLTAAFADVLGEGRPEAVIVGSDHPTLEAERIDAALDALAAADLVLGPTPDGGYYLVAASRPVPGLFDGIPWSTPRVLEATRERAAAAGLRVVLLDPWYDVDTAEDLVPLVRHLRALERGSGAPEPRSRTRAALERLIATGSLPPGR